MDYTSKIITTCLVGVLIGSCAKSGTTETTSNKSSNASLASVPKPPINKLAGKGFGLATEGPGEGTGEGDTATSASTTTSASTATVPAGAISAQGGGYWSKSTSGASGYGYQYYNSGGTATNWYGQPGSGSNASNFSMIQGSNTGQVFVAQKTADSWNGGKILDAKGNPYTYQDPNTSGSIVNSGYSVNSDGTMNYNWLAKATGNGASTSKPFQTSGYDLNSGMSSGMAYYFPMQNGAQGPVQQLNYIPPSSYVNGVPTTGEGGSPFQGFFNTIFSGN